MDMRLDRVIRCYWWGQQVCSLFLKDNRLYMIRTGMLGGVSDDKELHMEPMDLALDPIQGAVVKAALNPFNRALYWVVGKRLEVGEGRLASRPLDELAKGSLSASVALSEIVSVTPSMALQFKMKHAIPQLKIKTSAETYTLRFPPQIPVEGIARWEAALTPHSATS